MSRLSFSASTRQLAEHAKTLSSSELTKTINEFFSQGWHKRTGFYNQESSFRSRQSDAYALELDLRKAGKSQEPTVAPKPVKERVTVRFIETGETQKISKGMWERMTDEDKEGLELAA